MSEQPPATPQRYTVRAFTFVDMMPLLEPRRVAGRLARELWHAGELAANVPLGPPAWRLISSAASVETRPRPPFFEVVLTAEIEPTFLSPGITLDELVERVLAQLEPFTLQSATPAALLALLAQPAAPSKIDAAGYSFVPPAPDEKAGEP